MAQVVEVSSLVRGKAADKADWRDWRWQLRHAVGTVAELERAISLTGGELEGARRAASQGLPLRITPYYLSGRWERPVVPHPAAVRPRRARGRRGARRPGRSSGRGGARGRPSSRAALPRPGAASGVRPVRRLLPLLHALADGGER